jgi:hypothetical protein
MNIMRAVKKLAKADIVKQVVTKICIHGRAGSAGREITGEEAVGGGIETW